MADTKFIVTIGDAVHDELDVCDIQEAVVNAAQRVYDHIDHGNVDVELVQVVKTGKRRNAEQRLRYVILDVA